MSNIGDLFLQLLADGSKLIPSVQKEAAKAGDAGAKTLGAKLSSGLKTDGVKAFGAVAATAFGLAAAGALAMENAAVRFRAETGAGAEEAARAGKVINRVAGDERMALEAVNDIAIKVRRDLGATGDEADVLTAKFARFARVTRQDGATAVADFDDILDAWSLPAERSGEIMDKLVVSGQKYGGVITEDQKALAAMAPQLKAFNLGIDDGIALLNLFKVSGLDAASIPKALNSAIKKLDGRPVNDFIAELAGIEDPGKRATRAMEVFGKAGAGLANAIKPGMTSLDDLKISTEEATGATDKAADALDSTWGARFAKLMSQAGAAVRDFGSQFGSAAQAAAGLASLVTTLGGGRFLKAGAAVGGKFIAGIVGAIAASSAVTSIADGIGSVIGKVQNSGPVKAVTGRLGSFIGSALGKATILGFAAVLVVELWVELQKILDENKAKLNQIGADIATEIQRGSLDELKRSRAAVAQALVDLYHSPGSLAPLRLLNVGGVDEAIKNLEAQLAAIDAAIAAHPPDVAGAIDSTKPAVAKSAAEVVGQIPKALVAIGGAVFKAGAQAMLDYASGLRDKRSTIESAIDQLKEDIKNRMSPKKEALHNIGLLFGKTIARGLKGADPIVKAQAQGTRGLIEEELVKAVLAGGKAGEEIQKELEKKLKSKDPAVRAQAQHTKDLIDAALKATPGKNPGDVIGDQLATDLADSNTALGKTAYDLGRTIARNLLRGVHGSGVSVPSKTTGHENKHVPVYALGSWSVPGDQFAFIHDREMVVPRAEADAIRSGTATLGSVASGPLIGSLSLSVDASGHRDPAAVGSAVQRAVGDAMANVFRDESLRGLTGTKP